MGTPRQGKKEAVVLYINLKRVLLELPPKSWGKVGGSVYLVNEKYSHELRKLLKRFEGPELDWYEFRVET